MPDFLMLRHAPTDWNAAGRLQGRADPPLSAAGRAAASSWRVPDLVADWPVLASPLRRTMETAVLMGLAPVPAPAFVEMDWGACEGRTLAELRAEGGAAFAADEARGLDFRPQGGETPRETGVRALAGLGALGASHVIVTHKGVLRALLARALDWDMRGKAPVRLAPAAAQLFRLGADGLILLQANVPLGERSQP
ncbi:hypothetical protein GCM10011390_38690 [Aureimonas endophytica]|uniref:Phosphoglycerate mutase n=1 Tax=Aureimonas endophytica TaxID=2027858 RepID=A0A916ZVE8_9HYPH|nr:histidine phosphatase family protein [Aureimonas endophytica]GGE15893.1 hypothetical protein GCM10011390_38690 [Aureimonas endophytica]